MKAMVSALALRIGESALGRGYGRIGDAVDYAIPFVLLALIVVCLGAIVFGFVS